MTSSAAFPPLRLAALAAAAIGGLNVRRVTPSSRVGDVSSAVVTAESGEEYSIQAGHTPEASTELIMESRMVQMMHSLATEGFAVDKPAGRYSQGNLSAVLYERHDAVALTEGEIEADAAVRFLVGRAIGSVHLIPAHELEDSDLPYFEAAEIRTRKLHLLDAAAGTGRVPSVLLSRWERTLDEAGLWRFSVVPVHGDLHEDRFQREGNTLRISHWSALSVGDAAEDFAWIMAYLPEHRAQIFEAYASTLAAKDHPRDTALERRALFYAEFAVAEYLMSSVRQLDETRIESATALLRQLAEQVAPAEKSMPAKAGKAEDEPRNPPLPEGEQTDSTRTGAESTPVSTPKGTQRAVSQRDDEQADASQAEDENQVDSTELNEPATTLNPTLPESLLKDSGESPSGS